MAIWKRPMDLATLNERGNGSLVGYLGMQVTEFDENSLTMTMPVDERTHQPMGLLHGGASVALAESVGSIAANCCVEPHYYCVGLDINANHIRAVRSGQVVATATPAHLGATTQVWQIQICDERGRLVCTSRLTMAVLRHKGNA